MYVDENSRGRQPYTHQISLSFPVINTLLNQRVPNRCCQRRERAREGASLEEPAYYSSYVYLMKSKLMSLAVESAAQDHLVSAAAVLKLKVCKFILSKRIRLTEWCRTAPLRNSMAEI
jgi:hypothetical protein